MSTLVKLRNASALSLIRNQQDRDSPWKKKFEVHWFLGVRLADFEYTARFEIRSSLVFDAKKLPGFYT